MWGWRGEINTWPPGSSGAYWTRESKPARCGKEVAAATSWADGNSGGPGGLGRDTDDADTGEGLEDEEGEEGEEEERDAAPDAARSPWLAHEWATAMAYAAAAEGSPTPQGLEEVETGGASGAGSAPSRSILWT